MRRALKTLGVNFLEFDESGDSKKNSCEKVVWDVGNWGQDGSGFWDIWGP